MIRIILQVFYVIFSGIMEALSISNELLPFGSPFTAVFCLVPLYLALFRSESYRESYLLAAAQILTVHLLSSFWLANFHGFAAFTLGASALGTAFEGGFFGIFMHAFVRLSQDKTNLLKEHAGTFGLENCKSFTFNIKRQIQRFFSGHLVECRVLFFSILWVTWEWVKSTGAMGYPWGTLFLSAYRWKLITQIADITGVWGITFIFALANALFAEGVRLLPLLPSAQNSKYLKNCYINIAKLSAFIWGISLLYGLCQYTLERKPEKFMNAILVQQNIDPWEGGDLLSVPISMKLTQEQFNIMNQKGIKPDLVVWSEGVLERNFPQARLYYKSFPEEESLCDFIKRLDTPFLVGGGTRINAAKKKYSNSAILFDCEGEYAGFYSKKHLVPFAEQIPYRDNPFMKIIMEELVGMPYSLTPGKEFTLFTIPINPDIIWGNPIEGNLEDFAEIALDRSGKADFQASQKYIWNMGRNPLEYVSFTVPICFEDAFSDVCGPLYNMGSELFINITNDSWSKTASAEYQHFIASSYLSIEYRTTLVRCANSGYTVVCDPAGKILQSLPIFEQAALSAEIPVYERKPTFYSRHSNYLPHICVTIVLLFLAVQTLDNYIWKKKS